MENHLGPSNRAGTGLVTTVGLHASNRMENTVFLGACRCVDPLPSFEIPLHELVSGGASAARKGPACGMGLGAARSPDSGPFLGIDAKSVHQIEKVDPETGEITGGEPAFNPMENRVQRFALQSVARKLLPKSRTNNCLRVRQGSIDVQVLKSIDHKTTHYGGLQTCGSVWACPVCSFKIAALRRAEIQAAMAMHQAAGGVVNMLTLTAPHQFTDKLGDLLARQVKALHRFWSNREVKSIFQEMRVCGFIKASETTHGRRSPRNNGWHPHYHVLLFAGSGGDLGHVGSVVMGYWQFRLYEEWAGCCVRSGLGMPSPEHGLKLDDGNHAGVYISKWGFEDEMTKGHTKKALHGETPFDFLRSYMADPNDKQAAALFIEFAETFKGKRQLCWSPGLKKRYLIDNKTDDQAAGAGDDLAVLLGRINIDQWRDVLAVEGRGQVLLLAASGGWDAVQEYLGSIHVFKGEK